MRLATHRTACPSQRGRGGLGNTASFSFRCFASTPCSATARWDTSRVLPKWEVPPPSRGQAGRPLRASRRVVR